MPRQRFLNLAPKARKRLLAVATKHFARDGYERASLNAILAEVGISKGACYYYFDDKEDLFATALEAAFDDTMASLPLPALDHLAPRAFWPTIEAFVAKWGAAFDTSSDLFKVALRLTDEQRRSPRFAPIVAKGYVIYRAIIEPGQRLGCVRRDLSVDVLGRMLEANDALLDGLFVAMHPEVTRAAIEAHVALVFDTFKRLLMPDPFATKAGRADAKAKRKRTRPARG